MSNLKWNYCKLNLGTHGSMVRMLHLPHCDARLSLNKINSWHVLTNTSFRTFLFYIYILSNLHLEVIVFECNSSRTAILFILFTLGYLIYIIYQTTLTWYFLIYSNPQLVWNWRWQIFILNLLNFEFTELIDFMLDKA